MGAGGPAPILNCGGLHLTSSPVQRARREQQRQYVRTGGAVLRIHSTITHRVLRGRAASNTTDSRFEPAGWPTVVRSPVKGEWKLASPAGISNFRTTAREGSPEPGRLDSTIGRHSIHIIAERQSLWHSLAPMDTFDPGSRPLRSAEHCARCAATASAVAALTAHFVSLRCTHCGEIWLVRERRRSPRDAARFDRQSRALPPVAFQ